MSERNLVAIIKVPKEITLSFTSTVGTTPDVSVNGLLCLNWEYEGEAGDLTEMDMKSHIASEFNTGFQVNTNGVTTPESLATSISECLRTAPIRSEPWLDDKLPDAIVQICLADLTRTDFDKFNATPAHGINFTYQVG